MARNGWIWMSNSIALVFLFQFFSVSFLLVVAPNRKLMHMCHLMCECVWLPEDHVISSVRKISRIIRNYLSMHLSHNTVYCILYGNGHGIMIMRKQKKNKWTHRIMKGNVYRDVVVVKKISDKYDVNDGYDFPISHFDYHSIGWPHTTTQQRTNMCATDNIIIRIQQKTQRNWNIYLRSFLLLHSQCCGNILISYDRRWTKNGK